MVSQTSNSDEDYHSYVVLGSKFEVEKKYEIIEPGNLFQVIRNLVGTGAYGIVVSAKDTSTNDPENDLVAIKKIERAFEHPTFTKRTLRELKILRLLHHDNVFFIKIISKLINLKTIQLPKSRDTFEDM